MRLLIAALLLTLAVAVTASVFAIWPVIATPPWETQPAAVQPSVDPCVTITNQLAVAVTEIAANAIYRQGIAECRWPHRPGFGPQG
jgi:hypothetical protein